MAMPPTLIPYLALILLIASPINSQLTDAPQTVDHSPPYLALRSCAQLCFWQPYPGNFRSDAIASYLSCTQPSIYSGAFESCWCRQDYQEDVVDYISSCVRQKCESEPGDYKVDVSKAARVYEGYCASAVSRENGGTITPVSTGARETGAVSGFTDESTIDGAKTSLVESVPAKTGSSSTFMSATASNSENTGPTNTSSRGVSTGTKGLPTKAVVGIVVGAIVALLLVLLGIGASSTRVRKRLGWAKPAHRIDMPPPAQGRMSVGIYTANGELVKDGVVYEEGRAKTECLPGAREGV
ncbi:hypothetical protein TWF281_009556 [Arthrobotrys megalospora]